MRPLVEHLNQLVAGTLLGAPGGLRRCARLLRTGPYRPGGPAPVPAHADLHPWLPSRKVAPLKRTR